MIRIAVSVLGTIFLLLGTHVFGQDRFHDLWILFGGIFIGIGLGLNWMSRKPARPDENGRWPIV